MVKKWFFVLGVCLLTLGITACSDSKNENSTDPQVSEKDKYEEEKSKDPEKKDDESNEEEPDESDNQSVEIDEDQSITALVNKEYSLAENYAPEDLVKVDVPTVLENPEVNQLREVAADALKAMFDDAKESDVYLHARSGYRSYQTQVQLFQSYSDNHGEDAANRYSARPGQSEHQTGLVMDVTSESVNYQLEESFGETKEGKWLRDHAHEFGFIIRYPEGKEDITGYIYEPWHIRYLGVDVATKVYESGLTYEEYLEEEGIIHEVNS